MVVGYFSARNGNQTVARCIEPEGEPLHITSAFLTRLKSSLFFQAQECANIYVGI
jgi:hypothetical protein